MSTRDGYTLTKEDVDYANGLDIEEIGAIILDSTDAEASDGCRVEPDGICEHGRPSPLLTLGVM